MTTKQIVFVPGKDPKPDEALYSQLLWRTLVEGVRRCDSEVADTLQDSYAQFHLINWNDLYYHSHNDGASDIPWIDTLIGKRSPTRQDILDMNSWGIWLSRILLTMGDDIPFLMPLLPEEVQRTAHEIGRYFSNTDNVAEKVRELLKQTLRPMLEHQDDVLLIGHSLGSAIAYDTLWELSHQEGMKGKVDLIDSRQSFGNALL